MLLYEYLTPPPPPPPQGNNERCIKALIERDPYYVSFEQALWCVRCPELNPSIASKYVELIKGKLVGVAGGGAPSHHTSSPASDVCGRGREQSCAGEPVPLLCECT